MQTNDATAPDGPPVLTWYRDAMRFVAGTSMLAIVVIMVVQAIMIHLLWGKDLKATPEREARVMAMRPEDSITDWLLLKQSLVVLTVVMVAFVLARPLHLEPATVALAGASVALLVTRQSMHDTIASIEWATLFFLIGLFVMVGALEETGALEEVTDGIASVTGGDRVAELLGILWASAVGSALVDNIPFTAAMIPVVEQLQGDGLDDAYWWALALGACFGGNATTVAAAANVAAIGILDRSGQPLSFTRFLAIGVPITSLSLAIATVYLLVFQL